jgi:single-stranded DNA-binding protein
MPSKLYDLAVKTGEYTDQQGQAKGRYENIGAVMQGDDGGKFILLKRTFNPAGVPNPECRDNLIASMFEPRQQGQQQAPQQQQPQAAPAPQQQAVSADDFDDDDIPFS